MTDDIQAQQARASQLSLQLDQEASDLRRRVTGLEWHAGAGDTFRRVIDEFVGELSSCADDANDLANAIGKHADSAHAHADSIKTALHVVSLGLI